MQANICIETVHKTRHYLKIILALLYLSATTVILNK